MLRDLALSRRDRQKLAHTHLEWPVNWVHPSFKAQ